MHIKIKALAYFEFQNKLLVSEFQEPISKDYLYRPIGGTVEFGEYTKDALYREILEEINSPIEIDSLLCVIESIFQYNNESCHEIVYFYKSKFVDKSWYEDRIHYLTESDGSRLPMKWVPKSLFKENHLRLVPEKLLEFI